MAQQTEKKIALKPLGSRVLVQRLEPQEAVKGGILLPDSAKKKQETARVIAVGDGKKLEDGKRSPMTVKIGNVVVIDKYAGQEVSYDEEEFVIIDEKDIFAIIEE